MRQIIDHEVDASLHRIADRLAEIGAAPRASVPVADAIADGRAG